MSLYFIIKTIHLLSLSWAVRLKLIPSLQPMAPRLLKLSSLFNFLGGNNSGFFMELRDRNPSLGVLFEIVARSSDGLYIPCIPSVILTKNLITGQINNAGAYPCVGFVTLDEYLAVLKAFNIEWRLERTA